MDDHNDITTADDPVAEELTAYLDGELDAARRAAVERRLADDEAYRQRLQSLDDAWQLLDELPRTEVDPSFTQSTVEMVALAAEEEVQQAGEITSRRRWLHWVAGTLAIVLATMAGYLVVDHFASQRNDQLVRDLPVIENVELYRHVDSVDFLRQLDAEGLFVEEVQDES